MAVFFFATLTIVLALTLAVELNSRAQTAVNYATCVLQPVGEAKGVGGTIMFRRTSDGVHITGSINGLLAFREHGYHIHTYGDASINGKPFTIGPIFNPGHQRHGCEGDSRKVGSLGNVLADEHGVGTIDVESTLVKLGGDWSVVGRSLVVKDQRDKCTPSAESSLGSPYAHCTIEVADENAK